MSLATLKRKSKSTYRVSNTKHNVAGFSINGPLRLNNRIGQTMQMSKRMGPRGETVKIIHPNNKIDFISVRQGFGGNEGQYIFPTKYSSTCINYPCNHTLPVKQSVKNTKGLLASKKNKFITHLNITQDLSNPENTSQSLYIETKTTSCSNRDIIDIFKENKCNPSYKCTLRSCDLNKRINSRIIYPTKYSKSYPTIQSSTYLNNLKFKKANLPNQQYNSPWPPRVNPNNSTIFGKGCSMALTKQEFFSRDKIKQQNLKNNLCICNK